MTEFDKQRSEVTLEDEFQDWMDATRDFFEDDDQELGYTDVDESIRFMRNGFLFCHSQEPREWEVCPIRYRFGPASFIGPINRTSLNDELGLTAVHEDFGIVGFSFSESTGTYGVFFAEDITDIHLKGIVGSVGGVPRELADLIYRQIDYAVLGI